MTDRLVIEITGDLPDAGKFAVLASAEKAAEDVAAVLEDKYPGMNVVVTTRVVRPSKKTVTPAAVVQRRAAE